MQSPIPTTPQTTAIPRTLLYDPLHPDTGAGNLDGSEEMNRTEERGRERQKAAGSVNERYGKQVKDMDRTELVRYLKDSGVHPATAKNVEAAGIGGRDWVWTLTRITGVESFKTEIGAVGLLQLAKLVREADEGIKERDEKIKPDRKSQSPGKREKASKASTKGAKSPTKTQLPEMESDEDINSQDEREAVSYTHLTLPTILRV